MDVRVLGQLAVVLDGRSVPLGGRRQRAVLAGLIVHGAEGVSTAALVDVVWGDDPPATARKSLQTYVARLRQLLGPDAIGSRPDGYVWTLDPEHLDAGRFEELVRSARSLDDPARTWEEVGAALALWRGEPFSDVEPNGPLTAHVQRLREARLEAIELRASAGTAAGHHREVIADLQAMVESHPLREGLWEQLLLALDAAGRPAEAIEAFGRCRALLAEELGVDPSRRLQQLAERILRGAATPDPVPAPAPVPAPDAPAPVGRNPYKGLRAFLEDDHGDFFGRESLVDTLVRQLEARRFLALVGPSGAGKSSLALAGLVPALRRRSGVRTVVATMSPGTHPLAHLDAALGAVDPTDRLGRLRRRGDDLDLLRGVLAIVPGEQDEVLLVVDQLEELLTGAVAQAEVDTFLRNVTEAVEDPHGRLRVVVTLRADFTDAALHHPELAQLLGTAAVHVPPLTPLQLQAAVVGPARTVGLDVEPELVTELVSQTAQHPGSLPLLQFVLTELVEESAGTILTLAALERAGGVRGVLARRAEQVHARLSHEAQAATRLLFLRMVAVNDVGEATRRVVAVEDLDPPPARRGPTHEALDAFVASRLLVRDRDSASGRATVQVAHEAVLREWPRCADWIAQAGSDLRASMDLERAAADWSASDRSPDFLLTGDRLRAHERAVDRSELGTSPTARDYLSASVEHRRLLEETEAARTDHERRLERRAVQRLRAVVVVLLVLGLVTTSLSVYAIQRRNEAVRDRQQIELATTETLVRRLSFAAAAQGQDPQAGLLLALHAVRIATTAQLPLPTETLEALHVALQAAGVPYPVGDGAPTMLLTGGQGPTGAFALPLGDLVALARDNLTRQLSDAECRVHLATDTCPVLPDGMGQDLDDVPVPAAPRSGPRPLAGTTVTITGVSEEDFDAFRSEFEEFGETSGIDVRFTSEGVLQVDGLDDDVTRRVDVVMVPQPTYIAEEARGGRRLVDLSRYLSVEQLRADRGDHLVDLATVDDQLVALPLFASVKSLVWYSPRRFAEAGHAVPRTWDELLALSDRIVADGGTPWCFGEESGDASGWPATDWVEDLLLHEHGPEVYDAWVEGEVAFSDPRVADAFRRLGRLVFADGYTRDGGPGAVATNFASAMSALVADPPACWMLHQALFLSNFVPAEVEVGREVDVFPTPAITPGHAGATLVQASFALVLNDRPEVREVVRHLASPSFGEDLVDGLPIVMLNRRFALPAYDLVAQREVAARVPPAIRDGLLRNDGSDTMPGGIGTTPIWTAMLTYLREGPDSLDRVLAELDALRSTIPGD